MEKGMNIRRYAETSAQLSFEKANPEDQALVVRMNKSTREALIAEMERVYGSDFTGSSRYQANYPMQYSLYKLLVEARDAGWENIQRLNYSADDTIVSDTPAVEEEVVEADWGDPKIEWAT